MVQNSDLSQRLKTLAWSRLETGGCPAGMHSPRREACKWVHVTQRLVVLFFFFFFRKFASQLLNTLINN